MGKGGLEMLAACCRSVRMSDETRCISRLSRKFLRGRVESTSSSFLLEELSTQHEAAVQDQTGGGRAHEAHNSKQKRARLVREGDSVRAPGLRHVPSPEQHAGKCRSGRDSGAAAGTQPARVSRTDTAQGREDSHCEAASQGREDVHCGLLWWWLFRFCICHGLLPFLCLHQVCYEEAGKLFSCSVRVPVKHGDVIVTLQW